MLLGIANDGNPNAKPIGRSPLWHRFRRVVGSFGVNVRAEGFEQRLDTRFTEEKDVIDGAKRGDEEGAPVLVKNWAARALQYADARVGIDADDEDIAFAARALEIADVANVQHIKTPVGENDALAAIPVLR